MTQKSGHRRKIIYWIGAILLFAVFVTVLLLTTGRKQGTGSEVVFMGDSILAQERSTTSIPMLVGEDTHLMTVNCAIGGTTMSQRIGEVNKLTEGLNRTLCMVSLVHAIETEDFGAQQATKVTEAILSYVPYTVNTLSSILFRETDILVFNHGINDYHQGVPLDNEQDPYDTYTFGGAMRQVLSTLREEYPQLRVIYVTPPYSWYYDDRQPCTEVDYGQGTLDEYVALAKEICAEYQVEVVDVFEGVYDISAQDAASIYTLDGLHPNETGRRLIARKIAEAIVTE